MSSIDDFVHISTSRGSIPPHHSGQSVARDFYKSSKGERPFTEGVIVDAIRRNHPKHHLSVCAGYNCDFLGFADTEKDVRYSLHGHPNDAMVERAFIPPARRYGSEKEGNFRDKIVFGCYDYTYKGDCFLLYIVDGQDAGFKITCSYLLIEEKEAACEEPASKKADNLIVAAVSTPCDYPISLDGFPIETCDISPLSIFFLVAWLLTLSA